MEVPMVRGLAAAAALAALLSGACGRTTPEFSNPAEVIEVASGSDFSLVLESNQSTGFRWELTDTAGLGPLRVLGAGYESDDPHRNGVAGRERWHVRAGGPGEGIVTLVFRRPWETVPPVERRRFHVRVK
jgi:predicted secreted protein